MAVTGQHEWAAAIHRVSSAESGTCCWACLRGVLWRVGLHASSSGRSGPTCGCGYVLVWQAYRGEVNVMWVQFLSIATPSLCRGTKPRSRATQDTPLPPSKTQLTWLLRLLRRSTLRISRRAPPTLRLLICSGRPDAPLRLRSQSLSVSSQGALVGGPDKASDTH